MQQNADKQFVLLVDNNGFDKRNLIEIKIPNPIPYTKAVANFDRINGEITFKSKVYKYVYRKISEDYITILCLPDANKTEINNAEKKFEQTVNNTPQDKSTTKQTNKLVKVNLSDFDYFEFDFKFNNSAQNTTQNLTQHNFNLSAQTLEVAFQPPKNILSNPIV